MADKPADQTAAVQILAEQVDKLSGQVAALTAYVAYVANLPVAEDDVKHIQTVAQQISPQQIGPSSGWSPRKYATDGVETIQTSIRKLQSIRSGEHQT
jgi:hypothetical protein